jgi:hypothetical protein
MKISEFIWALRQYMEVSGDGEVMIYTADEVPYLAPLTTMANGFEPGMVVLHNSGMDNSERRVLADPEKWWKNGRCYAPDYTQPKPPKPRSAKRETGPGSNEIRGREESLNPLKTHGIDGDTPLPINDIRPWID